MNKVVQFADWVREIRSRIPGFVAGMSVPSSPGRYKFSLSGDIIPESTHWGLGQSTFAARILYIFGLLDDLKRGEISKYILSFKGKDDYVYDREIESRSRFPRFVSAVKSLSPRLYLTYTSKFAETRQAYAALINLGQPILLPRMLKAFDRKSIHEFVAGLNWQNPWGAASQINHLIFFIHFSEYLSADEKKSALDSIEDSLQGYRRADGSFYRKGDLPDINLRIGSAMKIFMGLSLVNRAGPWVNKEIYDLAFKFSGNCNACELFNANYVLYACSKRMAVDREELASSVLSRIGSLREHYWPDYGAFSFYPGKAGTVYYSAVVSKGFAEPDMHGTAMLSWSIFILSAMLGVNQELGLKEPVL